MRSPSLLVMLACLGAASAAGGPPAAQTEAPAQQLRGSRSAQPSVASSGGGGSSSGSNSSSPSAARSGAEPLDASAAKAPVANGTGVVRAESAAGAGACLCIFDIDRTLTGKQGLGAPTCPRNEVQGGIWDNAYGDGDLTLSELGRNVRGSACAACNLAVVSHGTAGGGAMKGMIRGLLQGSIAIPDDWSYPGDVHSPLVLGCAYKPPCVQGVVDWYNQQGAGVDPSNVYFFDDKRSNVESFHGSGVNAHQVSCATRDGGHGLCGAALAEVQLTKGVSTC